MKVRAGCADAERLRIPGEEVNDHAPRGADRGVHPGSNDRPEDFVPGGDGGRNAGLVRIQRMIVLQDSGGSDFRLREIMGCKIQFFQGAKHSLRFDPAEAAGTDRHSVREMRAVHGQWNQISLVNVPGPGNHLVHSMRAGIQLCNKHMVGIRMLFER